MKTILIPTLAVGLTAVLAGVACSNSVGTATSEGALSSSGSPRPCADFTPSQLRAAKEGFACIASTGGDAGPGAVFEVVSRATSGDQVWRDQNSGMMISAVQPGVLSEADGENLCSQMPIPDASDGAAAEPWRLPTGYPPNQNAAHGGQDSDLRALEREGFLEAVVAVQQQWLWLSSPSPYYAAIFFDPSSSRPINYDYGSNDGSLGAVCVRP
jgi:hypothetical protein